MDIGPTSSTMLFLYILSCIQGETDHPYVIYNDLSEFDRNPDTQLKPLPNVIKYSRDSYFPLHEPHQTCTYNRWFWERVHVKVGCVVLHSKGHSSHHFGEKSFNC